MTTHVRDPGAMTREGFERLHAELDELILVRRPAEERAMAEQRVAELRRALAEARIVEPPVDGSIGIGAYVRLRTTSGGTLECRVVGVAEAEPSLRRISVESPVGQALLGRTEGETVDVDAPGGRRRFEIVGVDYRCSPDRIEHSADRR